MLDRERGLDAIRRGLDVPGKGTLRWPAVGFINLYLRLTAEGELEVRRFTRCPLCTHPKRGTKIKKPWDATISRRSCFLHTCRVLNSPEEKWKLCGGYKRIYSRIKL